MKLMLPLMFLLSATPLSGAGLSLILNPAALTAAPGGTLTFAGFLVDSDVLLQTDPEFVMST